MKYKSTHKASPHKSKTEKYNGSVHNTAHSEQNSQCGIWSCPPKRNDDCLPCFLYQFFFYGADTCGVFVEPRWQDVVMVLYLDDTVPACLLTMQTPTANLWRLLTDFKGTISQNKLLGYRLNSNNFNILKLGVTKNYKIAWHAFPCSYTYWILQLCQTVTECS